MTTTHTIAALIGIGFLVGYPVVMRLLATAVQPVRLRMADIGVELLKNEGVSIKVKRLVNSGLDDAFNPFFMIFAAAVLPVVALAATFMKKPHDLVPIDDPYAKKLFMEFSHKYVIATAAANPAFALIAVLEVAVLSILLLPLGLMRKAQDVQIGTIEGVGKILHPHAGIAV